MESFLITTQGPSAGVAPAQGHLLQAKHYNENAHGTNCL